jgi:hypothetical protein
MGFKLFKKMDKRPKNKYLCRNFSKPGNFLNQRSILKLN